MARPEYSIARADDAHDHVLAFDGPEASVLVLLDGSGDWGGGFQAAEDVAAKLRSRWRDGAPGSIDGIASDLQSLAAAAVSRFDSPFGAGFHTIALLLRDIGSVELIHAGCYEVSHFSNDRRLRTVTPETWVGQNVREGRLTEEEARKHPMREIWCGPFIVERTPIHGPWPIKSGESVLVREKVFDLELSDEEVLAALAVPAMAAEKLRSIGFRRTQRRYSEIVVWGNNGEGLAN